MCMPHKTLYEIDGIFLITHTTNKLPSMHNLEGCLVSIFNTILVIYAS